LEFIYKQIFLLEIYVGEKNGSFPDFAAGNDFKKK
jgi:hypothetical protein